MKNFENPLRFDKVMGVSLLAYFFGPLCISSSSLVAAADYNAKCCSRQDEA